jgi:hypothetical protein
MNSDLKQLEYESATPARATSRRAVLAAASIDAAVVIAVNAMLLTWANGDRSWGAMAIAIGYGPIANAFLALLSLAFIPLVRHVSRGAPVLIYVLTPLLLPVTATVSDFLLIGTLPMHGC